LAPSVMETVNGFPSFSVVSCHLAFTLFALISLTVLRQFAWASVDSLRINKQTSNLKFVRAMLASKEMELYDIGPEVLWTGAQLAARWPRPARSTTGCALCSFLNMADALEGHRGRDAGEGAWCLTTEHEIQTALDSFPTKRKWRAQQCPGQGGAASAALFAPDHSDTTHAV
jgi:hypothetical protein